MKRLILTLLALTLLSGCTLGNTESETITETDKPYFFTYKTAEFEIEVPDTWDRLNSFTSEYPEELRIAFRNNIQDGDFLANVNVIREANPKFLLTADHSQKKLQSHTETLLNYQLLTQEAATLSIGKAKTNTFLNTFQGKHSSQDPLLQFMQISLTKGDQAWTITASYLPNEDPFVIERMRTMLTSFTLNE